MKDYGRISVIKCDRYLEVSITNIALVSESAITELECELQDLIESADSLDMIISFHSVQSYSLVSLVNLSLRVRKKIAGVGAQLVLCEMSDTIRDAYRTLNLDGTVFTIVDTLDDARQQLEQQLAQ